MDTSKRGQRIHGLIYDRANTWHVTFAHLVDLMRSLLSVGKKYVCMRKVNRNAYINTRTRECFFKIISKYRTTGKEII